jgi:hypothetical protein
VVWLPKERDLIVCDNDDNKIAVIAKASESKQFARAGIIAAAPALYEAVIATLWVFRVMAEHGSGPAALAAQDMIPSLESAVAAAIFWGRLRKKPLSVPDRERNGVAHKVTRPSSNACVLPGDARNDTARRTVLPGRCALQRLVLQADPS